MIYEIKHPAPRHRTRLAPVLVVREVAKNEPGISLAFQTKSTFATSFQTFNFVSNELSFSTSFQNLPTFPKVFNRKIPNEPTSFQMKIIVSNVTSKIIFVSNDVQHRSSFQTNTSLFSSFPFCPAISSFSQLIFPKRHNFVSNDHNILTCIIMQTGSAASHLK